MKRLVESVPNFSEGRDLAKVDAIIAAMREVPGVYLLDRESDADHNRSVVTIAGEPDAVAEAALRGVAKAAELIDLTKHSGAHPRMGATDVVPFIPVEGVSIETASLSRRKSAAKFGSVIAYRCISTRPPRSVLSAATWKIFARVSSRACSPKSRQIPIAHPISANNDCTLPPARRSSARANSWWLTTSTSTLRTSKSRKKSARTSASRMAACVT